MPARYDQPFYVGWNNPRFPYARYGYLPALEEPEPPPPLTTYQPKWTQREQYQVDQLRAQVLHLQSKVEELLSKRKRKAKF